MCIREYGTPPSLHRYLYAYHNPTIYVDPNGNITLLKEGADRLGQFRGWLEDQTDQYGEGWLAGLGAVTTGVSRAIVGAGEFSLRGVNYVANWGSMSVAGSLGLDDADWAQAHAQELMDTHETVGNVYTYLRNGGVGELAEKGVHTVGKALEGDTAALGDLTEFTAGFGLGGGVAGKAGKLSATTTAVANGTRQVVKKTTETIVKNAVKITGEIKNGIVDTGKKVLEKAKTVYNKSPLSNEIGAVRIKDSTLNNSVFYFNKTHKGALPNPKGMSPSGGRLQSHHGLQKKWAMENLKKYGYDPDLAPTVTIETGKGFPHTKITNRQMKRWLGRGKKYDTSINDELNYIVDDFKTAGFNDETISKVLNQQYKMLDKLGVNYSRIDGF